MFYFIRHGLTDWNLTKKCQGSADIGLNAQGKAQAKALREQLKDVRFDLCLCSPLLRARQTFEIALGRKPTPAEIDKRLAERDFGEFEGLTRAEFDFRGFWHKDGKMPLKTAESIADFRLRVESVFKDLKAECANKNVLLVSHGGVGFIWSALFLGVPESGVYCDREQEHGKVFVSE